MAFTQNVVLSSVNVLLVTGLIQVRWDKQILDGEELVSSVPIRKVYSADKQDEFLAEVDGASGYIAVVGW